MNRYIHDKVASFLSQLGGLKSKRAIPLDNFKYISCDYKTTNLPPDENQEWREFLPYDVWGGKADAHAWFKGKVVLTKNDTPAELTIKTGFEGWTDSNPQFLIYVNGKITQGGDRYHTTVRFNEPGEYEIWAYAYTGMCVDDVLRFITGLNVIDKNTEKLYYDLKVPYDVLECLDKGSREYSELLHALNGVLNLVDFRKPHSEEYAASIVMALNHVDNIMYPDFNRERVSVATVGHAHIDTAWMWPLRQTKEKAQRTFATVLTLMDLYPDFTFSASQPVLYQMVKNEAPELYERIKERVEDGRWEPQGAMFVESDCVLTSGESLVRQIIYGQRFFKEEFGVTTDVLWLPDAFGFSGQLPQIIKKSNLKFFVTSKLSWSDTQKFPYDMFSWRGIDGSEIPSYFLTAQAAGSKVAGTTYNGLLTPSMVKGTDERLQQKVISDETLLAFGYGDGGGGPSKEFLENHIRMKKGITSCPTTRMTTISAFFDEMLGKYDVERLPKWTGELYLEFHRGVYTSMAKNKRNNRKSEILLRNAEIYSAMAQNMLNMPYDTDALDEAWKLVLLNQFHDILPGSSIKEVYQDSDKHYARAAEIGNGIVKNALEGLETNVKTKGGIIAYNPNSFEANSIAYLDNTPVMVDNIPALGYTVLQEIKTKCSVKTDNRRIENTYYIVEFDENYNISRIYDKEAQREVLAYGQVIRLVAFEDLPPAFDAWEINGNYADKRYEVDDVIKVEHIQEGISAGFAITRKFLNSTITQKVVLYSDNRRIDFITQADWQDSHILLKALFPLNLHSESVTCDTQFGTIQRNTYRNTLFDIAKFEFCAHKFVDMSEDDYGVAVLNDCKYGYHTWYNAIGLTLLRAPTYPNPDEDKGHHEFTYSLLPHKGNCVAGTVIHEAQVLNNPVILKAISANEAGHLPESYSFASVEEDKLILETIKKAEDGEGFIIRLYDTFNRRGTAMLNLGFAVKEAYLCNLVEENIKKLEVNDNQVAVNYKNFEIITLRVIV